MNARRRQCLRIGLGLGLLLGAGAHATQPRLQWRERALIGFGTTLWLRAAGERPARVEAGLDAAVAAIRHIERQMSLFDGSSAVATLNRAGALRDPDPHLLRVVSLAEEVASRSGGAFDITIQPLWRAWADSRGMPSASALDRACSLANWRAVRASARRIEFARPGMAITLNGIAQGYAADVARQVLLAHGIEHALIDAGEWASLGRAPSGEPWKLGVASPRDPRALIATLATDGRAVATSSDEHLTFSADRRHHHILDPRNGYSPPDVALATVVADSCALADALTKVIFMGGFDRALPIAAQWGVDVLVVDKLGRWQASRGLRLA